MAIYGDNHRLAFCREGDKRWSLLSVHEENFDFCDVVYWKGSFYALNSDGNVVVVVVVDCDSGNPVRKIIRRIVTPECVYEERKRYLLVSGDELLMVSKEIKFCFGDFNSWILEYPDEENQDGNYGEEYEVDDNEYVVDEDEGCRNVRDDDDEGEEDGNYGDENDDDEEEEEEEEEGDGNEDDAIPEWVDDTEFGTYLYKTNRFKVFKLDVDEEEEMMEEEMMDIEDENEEQEMENEEEIEMEDENEDEQEMVDENEEEEMEDEEEEVVYEKQKKRLIWVEVTSLKDRMLFVGNNFGLSFSAKDFPECKGDHIYFTDDYLFGYTKNLVGGHDLGAYNIKNGTVESLPCSPKFSWLIWPPPCWVTLSPY